MSLPCQPRWHICARSVFADEACTRAHRGLGFRQGSAILPGTLAPSARSETEDVRSPDVLSGPCGARRCRTTVAAGRSGTKGRMQAMSRRSGHPRASAGPLRCRPPPRVFPPSLSRATRRAAHCRRALIVFSIAGGPRMGAAQNHPLPLGNAPIIALGPAGLPEGHKRWKGAGESPAKSAHVRDLARHEQCRGLPRQRPFLPA